MKVRSFVCGSALFLAVWLGVTFVHEESPGMYPNQRRAAASVRHSEVPVGSTAAADKNGPETVMARQ